MFVAVVCNVSQLKSYTLCEQACMVLYDFVFILMYLPVIYLLFFYPTQWKTEI